MTVLGETAREVGRFFDQRADQYEQKASSPYQRLLREITWQHIRPYLPRKKGARILDAGGASGYWSVRLALAGYEVVLLDASEEMIRLAQEKIVSARVTGKVEVVLGDVTDMREFSEGSFDAALALTEPLSFCGDPEMAVAELALVTKSGGLVATSVINRFRSRELEKFIKRGDVDGLEHYLSSGVSDRAAKPGTAGITSKAFSAEEVETLFQANGLEIVSSIGKPVFAEAAGAKLADAESFSKVLGLEIANNNNRALWSNAEVLEFVAIKA